MFEKSRTKTTVGSVTTDIFTCGGGNTIIGLKWRDLAYDRDAWKEKVYVAKFKATKGNITL